MAGRDAGDTMVHDADSNPGNPGIATGQDRPGPDGPIPWWRRPIALVGWALLNAILLALIIWGILQLVRDNTPQEPSITIAPTVTSKTPTTPRSSAAPVTPSTRPPDERTTTPETDNPTASTESTGAPATSSAPAPGASPNPQPPSVITLPSIPGLPGLPTEITLPPGL